MKSLHKIGPSIPREIHLAVKGLLNAGYGYLQFKYDGYNLYYRDPNFSPSSWSPMNDRSIDMWRRRGEDTENGIRGKVDDSLVQAVMTR